MSKANVIYRGPVEREPETINLPVAAASKPGIAVTITNGKLTALANAGAGRLLILSNRRFFGQTIEQAYLANDTGIAYRVEGEQEYNVQLVAATYSYGQEIAVGAGGVFKAAAAGDLVVAFCDKDVTTTAAAPFGDIVINSLPYAKA